MKLVTEINEEVGFVINEDKETGKKSHFIEGVFLQSGITNRNGRMYNSSTCKRSCKIQ